MTVSRLIPGRPLLGFSTFFEGAWGDDKTSLPYPRVTPSRIGLVLLPFRCPHCGEVATELASSPSRDRYHDKARGFYWCPSCGKRLEIDLNGTPLDEALPADAICAPALVDRGGEVSRVDGEGSSLDILGALL